MQNLQNKSDLSEVVDPSELTAGSEAGVVISSEVLARPEGSSISFLNVYSQQEFGQLYYDKGDFSTAAEKWQIALSLALEESNHDVYLRLVPKLLRLYADMEKETELLQLKEQLQDVVLHRGLELNSKIYYALALCASYKGQDEVALSLLSQALRAAKGPGSQEDICYAICGTALVYAGLKKYKEALREIYNLDIFLESLHLPEIRISSLILNAGIFIELNKTDQAIELLWKAMDWVRETKTTTMHIYALFNLGRAYKKNQNREMAYLYLNLAQKMVDPRNMVHISRSISEELDSLKREEEKEPASYDLIFDPETNFLMEKKLGGINFKNQFILLDLLRLFLNNPGQVYSKELLVDQVWKQTYDPAVHDNKIYVTIKRLKRMIEPELDKPTYIFRAKNGYFLNRTARVLIQPVAKTPTPPDQTEILTL